MKNFIDMLNCTLATVEEEKKKISNRFDEEYSEKIEKLVSKISKEYEDLEKVVDTHCTWIEIDKEWEVAINAFCQLRRKDEYSYSSRDSQYSILEYKKVPYALNSKAEGLYLGGQNKIRPLNEVLRIYLKNEDLIKNTIQGKFKKDFDERLNKSVNNMKDKKEFAELIDSHC